MNIDRFKDIEIEGRKYRICGLSPLVGNWIATVIMQGKAHEEEIFAKVQAHCLSACMRYVGEPAVPIPIFAPPDRFLVPDLTNDISTVSELQDAVIEFNLKPFFAKLEAKLKALRDAQATA